MFAETYGPPGVQALTRASRLFLAEAAGTSFPSLETSLLTARGVLWAVSEESSRLEHGLASLPGATELSAAQCRAMCPALREDFVLHGFFEPDAMDMDVAALHQGFMGEARKRGATFVFDAAVARATQHGAGGWQVETRSGDRYACSALVNAAGAWAQQVSALCGASAVPMAPKRRTVFTFTDRRLGDASAHWPFVMDAKVAVHSTERAFYFKPQAPGVFLASPGDATPSEPCDVAPDEMDIALCVDALMAATSLEVRRIDARWAGLRTFSPDGEPVLGKDPLRKDFYHVTGLGGYGIQTAPACGDFVADLIERGALSSRLTGFGLTAQQLSPERFA